MFSYIVLSRFNRLHYKSFIEVMIIIILFIIAIKLNGRGHVF